MIRAVPAISPSAGVRAISSCGLAAHPLGGDREAAVLDEAAGVDEVGEVLARRAPPRSWRRSTASGRASSPVSRRRSSTSARSSRTPSSPTRETLAYASAVGLTVTNATLEGVAVGLRCADGEIAAIGPGVEPPSPATR